MTQAILLLVLATAWGASQPDPSGPACPGLDLAYIGPGAGFAFLGSFLGLLAGLLLAVGSLLLWPLRFLWRLAFWGKPYRSAKARKVLLLGLDGLDPRLAERFMEEGKLPALRRLKEQGYYSRLRTTFPALSPTAWSTFATGVSPARHGIFDFLSRDPATYLPELSSSKVHESRTVWRLGRYRIPLSRPWVENRRKSRTFWSILGSHRIASTILRVPITFPPERFGGRLLSAMCVPDVRGTQGTFSVFTTSPSLSLYEGGKTLPLQRRGRCLTGSIPGPPNHLVEGGGELACDFAIRSDPGSGSFTLTVAGESSALLPGKYSPWIRVRFRGPLGLTVRGICRFLILATEPELRLYVSPVNLDPEKPALPISHPGYYAGYLAKLLGPYATLGLAEDTWALNEGVLSEDAFLNQAYDICAEREAMFFSTLEHTRRGVVACVFDTPDRLQHMFYSKLEEQPGNPDSRGRGVIEELYCRMDRLVERTMRHVDAATLLIVFSDHGVAPFRRGVDLNAWLWRNGFLAFNDGGCAGTGCFQGVDWKRTRAYALGLAGIYLNLKGRESCGIVEPGAEAHELLQELMRMLSGLQDEECKQTAINGVFATGSLYQGPYLEAAPDLLVAYNSGYRTSWGAALGRVGEHVFEDNRRAWSGDHCMDPRLVPGVIFCNRAPAAGNPGLEDLAPTVLDIFGLKPPPYMEGKPLFRSREHAE